MLSASRQIATWPPGSSLASAEAISRCISLRRQRRFRSTRQARSHRTSRLSSRSFQGVRLQNKGFVICTAAFRVHPERKDAVQVQAGSACCFRPPHASFTRFWILLSRQQESIVATYCHNHENTKADVDLKALCFFILRWGCRETLRQWMPALLWARPRSLPQGVLVIHFGSAASWRPCNVVWPHQ